MSVGHNLAGQSESRGGDGIESGPQQGRVVLEIPGGCSGGHYLGVRSALGILWVETRDTLKCPVMHGLANKEVIRPECQPLRSAGLTESG